MYAPEPPDPPRSQPQTTWQPGSRISPVPTPVGYPTEAAQPAATQVRAQQMLGRWLRIPGQRPIVTQALIVVLFLIYVPMALIPQLDDQILNWGANLHDAVMQGEWYRLITATFLHASINGIPFIHLLSNAYGLWVIGLELEKRIGRVRYAAIYAISAVAGSVASFAFLPANVPSVGASGAIFGLVGALAVYFALHRKLLGKMGNVWFWNMVVIIILNEGIGLSGVLPVDNSAHLGGLVAGAVVGFVLSPRYALGDWYNMIVRNVVNTNKGPLPWIAAVLIALIIVFTFIDLYLLFSAGILASSFALQ